MVPTTKKTHSPTHPQEPREWKAHHQIIVVIRMIWVCGAFSLTSLTSLQKLIQPNNKKTIKYLHYSPFVLKNYQYSMDFPCKILILWRVSQCYYIIMCPWKRKGNVESYNKYTLRNLNFRCLQIMFATQPFVSIYIFSHVKGIASC